MSTADVTDENSAGTPSAQPGEAGLEVVVLPVSDVDRAKRFYQDLGWRLDADLTMPDGLRVVPVTPPGSLASVIFGSKITSATPSSVEGLVLSVYDIDATRAELISHGVEVSELFHDEGGVFHHAGAEGRATGPDPEGRSYATWASFSDPDGNGCPASRWRTCAPTLPGGRR
jgi:catechol 2,3-dioxygenase-like lactoylglutathione lyase family enzyme